MLLFKSSVVRSLFMAGALVSSAAIGLASTAKPAAAQQLIGFQNGVPICNGPLGVAPCVVIQDWLAAHQFQPQPNFQPQPPVFVRPQVVQTPVAPPAGNTGGGDNNPLQQFGNFVQQAAPVIGIIAPLFGG